jgi:ribonuclease E
MMTPRESRASPVGAPWLITEPQRIKGSTRLEAKKQRRRDGREAGRRRTVVTEAEFLARREAVDRDMIVRSKNGRIQIAVLEDNVLVEHYVARSQESSLIGNVYLGRVQNVLPSMEAAFVDIGRGRNAVLYPGGRLGCRGDGQPAAANRAGAQERRPRARPGHEGPCRPAGRAPDESDLAAGPLPRVRRAGHERHPRKLPTPSARLKRILKRGAAGVQRRHRAHGRRGRHGRAAHAGDAAAHRAVEHISSQVEKIGALGAPAPEPDLLVKIVRDVFNEDFTKMLIQARTPARRSRPIWPASRPTFSSVEKYEDDQDLFDRFRVTSRSRRRWTARSGCRRAARS